jgi:histidinol dehydrogenase
MPHYRQITNHREREKGVIVYPVYSRRSGGLSVGINLFPDKKTCPFDCPYCEVFPFSTGAVFLLKQMEEDLRIAIKDALEQSIPIKDLCFSGNGEPSLSVAFPDALKMAANIRKELAPSAKLVLITNGTGLLQPSIFSMLAQAAIDEIALDIWLKLDAGTPEWYKKINRSSILFTELTEKIREFASLAPVTIQTMLCAIGGESPYQTEAQAWERLAMELAVTGNIRKVQVYGKARPAPEDPLASPLPSSYLEQRAASLRRAFSAQGITTPVEVYL